MHSDFLIRETVLDAQQRVLGHELSWQQTGAESLPTDEDIDALAQWAAHGLNSPEGEWLLPDTKLFLEATPALLHGTALDSLPSRSLVLRLTAADLADPAVGERLAAMGPAAPAIALRDIAGITPESPLLALVNVIEIDAGADDLPQRARQAAMLRQPTPRILARRVADWETYDRCAALGLDVVTAQMAHGSPAQRRQEKAGLNASQTVILEAMKLVRVNAAAASLEAVMKRDAALSYKLFRYINSVGFGLGAEITTLRHAVTMLGYSTLYRWLSLLLATASTGAHAAALMQTAIIRGRFMELLGAPLLPKGETENLFVTGMFSLLDQLLGMPMEQVLEHVQLSENISLALLERQGVYAPFLALVEACERPRGDAAAAADALFVGSQEVNTAHLAALAWAQAMR